MSFLDTALNFAKTGGLLPKDHKDPRYPATTPLVSSAGQALMDAPFDAMLISVAEGIANAQFEMDLGAVKIAQLMAGMEVDGVVLGDGGRFDFGRQPGAPDSGTSVTLLELGFQPTFYELRHASIEFRMTVSINQETVDRRSARDLSTGASLSSAAPWAQLIGWGPQYSATANVSMVNEETSSKYGFEAEGSSRLRVSMRPVPAPDLLESRIASILAEREASRYRLPDLEGKTWKAAIDLLLGAALPLGLGGVEWPEDQAATTITAFEVRDGTGAVVDTPPGGSVDVIGGHKVFITGTAP